MENCKKDYKWYKNEIWYYIIITMCIMKHVIFSWKSKVWWKTWMIQNQKKWTQNSLIIFQKKWNNQIKKSKTLNCWMIEIKKILQTRDSAKQKIEKKYDMEWQFKYVLWKLKVLKINARRNVSFMQTRKWWWKIDSNFDAGKSLIYWKIVWK